MKITHLAFWSLIISVVIVGCSDKEEYKEMPADVLYKNGVEQYEKGSYTKAAKTFMEVERQHPYSEYAVEAQLMSAVAYYEGKKYDDAIESFRVFIQLHPGHPKIPYAYYMLGLSYYEQIKIVERDQEETELAEAAFIEVMERFPGTKYAKDAKSKLDLVYDHLAGREMTVGRFYQKQNNFVSAVNRFKTVVSEYQTTSHVPEALHRMVECYLALGIIDQAESTAAVLGHNYPGSHWYRDSYALVHPGKKAPVVKKSKPRQHSGLKASSANLAKSGVSKSINKTKNKVTVKQSPTNLATKEDLAEEVDKKEAANSASGDDSTVTKALKKLQPEAGEAFDPRQESRQIAESNVSTDIG